jgi:hypothetical protein
VQSNTIGIKAVFFEWHFLPQPQDKRMSGEPIFKSDAELAQLSASERIRYRLVRAKCRYHANDNIAPFVLNGEMDELQTEVQSHLQQVLQALVIDTDSDHNTQDTAKRVAKMFSPSFPTSSASMSS